MAWKKRLTEAVRLRMIADVPLGALLSGGVDSSVVVALMAKLSGKPIRTFSIGFREEAFNELPYAQQAAAICGTTHQPEIVEGDVANLLPLLAAHYGEPYADSSAVPSFLVARTARRHVTVAMNGDGGDELSRRISSLRVVVVEVTHSGHGAGHPLANRALRTCFAPGVGQERAGARNPETGNRVLLA
ncbi:MAG: hypothetical protein IPJ33_00800 [Gammaproteobacteria bacterium]|nr:hypothetical protein [Gammaproteobacteria bacterium]